MLSVLSPVAGLASSQFFYVIKLLVLFAVTVFIHEYNYVILVKTETFWNSAVYETMFWLREILQVFRVIWGTVIPLWNFATAVNRQIFGGSLATMVECNLPAVSEGGQLLVRAAKELGIMVLEFIGSGRSVSNVLEHTLRIGVPVASIQQAIIKQELLLDCACNQFAPFIKIIFEIVRPIVLSLIVEEVVNIPISLVQDTIVSFTTGVWPTYYRTFVHLQTSLHHIGRYGDTLIVGVLNRLFEGVTAPLLPIIGAFHPVSAGVYATLLPATDLAYGLWRTIRDLVLSQNTLSIVVLMDNFFSRLHQSTEYTANTINWIVKLRTRFLTKEEPGILGDVTGVEWYVESELECLESTNLFDAGICTGHNTAQSILVLSYALIRALLEAISKINIPDGFDTFSVILQRYEGKWEFEPISYACETRSSINSCTCDYREEPSFVGLQSRSAFSYSPYCTDPTIQMALWHAIQAADNLATFVSSWVKNPNSDSENAAALLNFAQSLLRSPVELARAILRILFSIGDIVNGDFFGVPINCGHGVNLYQYDDGQPCSNLVETKTLVTNIRTNGKCERLYSFVECNIACKGMSKTMTTVEDALLPRGCIVQDDSCLYNGLNQSTTVPCSNIHKCVCDTIVTVNCKQVDMSCSNRRVPPSGPPLLCSRQGQTGCTCNPLFPSNNCICVMLPPDNELTVGMNLASFYTPAFQKNWCNSLVFERFLRELQLGVESLRQVPQEWFFWEKVDGKTCAKVEIAQSDLNDFTQEEYENSYKLQPMNEKYYKKSCSIHRTSGIGCSVALLVETANNVASGSIRQLVSLVAVALESLTTLNFKTLESIDLSIGNRICDTQRSVAAIASIITEGITTVPLLIVNGVDEQANIELQNSIKKIMSTCVYSYLTFYYVLVPQTIALTINLVLSLLASIIDGDITEDNKLLESLYSFIEQLIGSSVTWFVELLKAFGDFLKLIPGGWLDPIIDIVFNVANGLEILVPLISSMLIDLVATVISFVTEVFKLVSGEADLGYFATLVIKTMKGIFHFFVSNIMKLAFVILDFLGPIGVGIKLFLGSICQTINEVVWFMKDAVRALQFDFVEIELADRKPICEPLSEFVNLVCDNNEVFCQQPDIESSVINGYCDHDVPRLICEDACNYACEHDSSCTVATDGMTVEEKNLPEAPSGCLFQKYLSGHRCYWNTYSIEEDFPDIQYRRYNYYKSDTPYAIFPDYEATTWPCGKQGIIGVSSFGTNMGNQCLCASQSFHVMLATEKRCLSPRTIEDCHTASKYLIVKQTQLHNTLTIDDATQPSGCFQIIPGKLVFNLNNVNGQQSGKTVCISTTNRRRRLSAESEVSAKLQTQNIGDMFKDFLWSGNSKCDRLMNLVSERTLDKLSPMEEVTVLECLEMRLQGTKIAEFIQVHDVFDIMYNSNKKWTIAVAMARVVVLKMEADFGIITAKTMISRLTDKERLQILPFVTRTEEHITRYVHETATQENLIKGSLAIKEMLPLRYQKHVTDVTAIAQHFQENWIEQEPSKVKFRKEHFRQLWVNTYTIHTPHLKQFGEQLKTTLGVYRPLVDSCNTIICLECKLVEDIAEVFINESKTLVTYYRDDFVQVVVEYTKWKSNKADSFAQVEVVLPSDSWYQEPSDLEKLVAGNFTIEQVANYTLTFLFEWENKPVPLYGKPLPFALQEAVQGECAPEIIACTGTSEERVDKITSALWTILYITGFIFFVQWLIPISLITLIFPLVIVFFVFMAVFVIYDYTFSCFPQVPLCVATDLLKLVETQLFPRCLCNILEGIAVECNPNTCYKQPTDWKKCTDDPIFQELNYMYGPLIYLKKAFPSLLTYLDNNEPFSWFVKQVAGFDLVLNIELEQNVAGDMVFPAFHSACLQLYTLDAITLMPVVIFALAFGTQISSASLAVVGFFVSLLPALIGFLYTIFLSLDQSTQVKESSS